MAASNAEGMIYIPVPGSRYDVRDIDADVLREVLGNEFVKSQYKRLLPRIFSGMYRLSAKDGEGEEDEDLTNHLMAMYEAPGVDLWSRMRQSWLDIRQYGPFVMYPRWGRNGAERTIMEFRRLDPYSFRYGPTSMLGAVYSEILQGITLGDDGEVEFYQIQDDTSIEPVKLKKGVLLLRDPLDTSLAGESDIIPLIPIVRMLSDAMLAQAQKVYRVGAPIMFISVDPVGGRPDDKEYAENVIENWGRDTAFQLRPNMKFVELQIRDEETALATIDKLQSIIEAHFNGAANLQAAQGSTIGGNAASAKETDDEMIMGERTMIEDLWEGVLQQYFVLNGYEGYTVEITIAAKKQSPGYIEARQAEVGFSTGCMTINERREKLGLSPLDDTAIAELLEERAAVQAAIGSVPSGPDEAFGAPLGEMEQRARVVRELAQADPMDPERYMSFEEQREILRPKKARS